MGCCSSREAAGSRQQQLQQQYSRKSQVTTEQPKTLQFPSISFKEAKAARAEAECSETAKTPDVPPAYEDLAESIPLSTKDDPLKDTCTICNCVMTDHEQVLPLGCKHIFHLACVKPYMLEEIPSCPRCKTQFYIPGPDGKIPEHVQKKLQEQQQNQRKGGSAGAAQSVTINNYNGGGGGGGMGLMPLMMMPMLMPMFMPRFRPIVVARPVVVAPRRGYGYGRNYCASRGACGGRIGYGGGYGGGARCGGGGYGGARYGGRHGGRYGGGRMGGHGRRR